MLYVADIVSTLQRHCADHAPPNWKIVYPGVPCDASGLSRWCEFWMTSVDDRVRRNQGADSLLILVDLHIFSRDKETRAIDIAADALRGAFSRSSVSIVSPASQQITGRLRFREAALRDMSRQADSEPRLPIRHVVVSTTGVAEEAPG